MSLHYNPNYAYSTLFWQGRQSTAVSGTSGGARTTQQKFIQPPNSLRTAIYPHQTPTIVYASNPEIVSRVEIDIVKVDDNPVHITKQKPKSVTAQIPEIPKDFSPDPSSWGPTLWYYLHCSAANYPKKPTTEQRDAMKIWLSSLSVTIPCANCGHHFNEFVRSHQNNLDTICSSREKLFNFLVDAHNKVNQRNGKSSISYEEARKQYYNA